MLITGIIGYPLRNTLSPMLHNAAFLHSGIRGAYISLPVKPVFLKETIDRVRTRNFRGVNITAPYKEMILDHADASSAEVQFLGAANTIVVEDGQLHAYNSDVYGFQMSLDDHRIAVKDRRVLLIGAGGAGRACARVLNARRPGELFIASRNRGRAKKLSLLFDAEAVEMDKAQALIRAGIDIVVNATTADLHRTVFPLLAPRAVYYDLNYSFRYRPKPDVRAVNGIAMLVYQAARSFSLWTGIKPPLHIMKVKAGLSVPNRVIKISKDRLDDGLRAACRSFKGKTAAPVSGGKNA